MTSPFTGTDELGATRQDGAGKYFLLRFTVTYNRRKFNIRSVSRDRR